MRSASIADWILRRVVGKERAVAMVGDLVEISQQKGMVWFWLAVGRVVAARMWRPILGLMLVSYSGFWISYKLGTALFGRHYPPNTWILVLGVFQCMGIYLCWATVYSAIRFGVRDRFVQAAFAIAVLCVVLVYGWWQPVVVGCCIAGFAGVAAISVGCRERRRAALTLPLVAAAGILSAFLGAKASYLFIRYGLHWDVGQLVTHEHPGTVWMGLMGMVASPYMNPVLFMVGFWGSQVLQTLAIAAACEVMHRWSMSKPKNDQMLEDGEVLPDIS
jgi:hypothetical protein